MCMKMCVYVCRVVCMYVCLYVCHTYISDEKHLASILNFTASNPIFIFLLFFYDSLLSLVIA